MVEFSENFNKRYEGKVALVERVKHRVSVRLGEIPYFNGGIDIREFSLGDNSSPIKKVVKDLGADVKVSGGNVVIAEIVVPVSVGL